MLYGQPCKFRRYQHGAFDMNMSIDQPRQDILIWNIIAFPDRFYDAVIYKNLTIEDASFYRICDLSFYTFHRILQKFLFYVSSRYTPGLHEIEVAPHSGILQARRQSPSERIQHRGRLFYSPPAQTAQGLPGWGARSQDNHSAAGDPRADQTPPGD